jgi:hypothetical protein
VNKIGAVWRQNCNTGYHLEAGSDTLICDTNGYWNSTQCIRGNLPDHQYLNYLSSESLSFNRVILPKLFLDDREISAL